MTAAQYLSQLYIIKARIDEEIAVIGRMRDSALSSGSVCYDREKVQSSVSNTSMDHVIRYVDAEAIVDRKTRGLITAWNRIIEQIEHMCDPVSSHILYSIYVDDKTIRQIADGSCTGYWTIYHRYKEALSEFENQYSPLHNYCNAKVDMLK
jgi:hypothetical protein